MRRGENEHEASRSPHPGCEARASRRAAVVARSGTLDPLSSDDRCNGQRARLRPCDGTLEVQVLVADEQSASFCPVAPTGKFRDQSLDRTDLRLQCPEPYFREHAENVCPEGVPTIWFPDR